MLVRGTNKVLAARPVLKMAVRGANGAKLSWRMHELQRILVSGEPGRGGDK